MKVTLDYGDGTDDIIVVSKIINVKIEEND